MNSLESLSSVTFSHLQSFMPSSISLAITKCEVITHIYDDPSHSIVGEDISTDLSDFAGAKSTLASAGTNTLGDDPSVGANP
jgi:hypothetical protein